MIGCLSPPAPCGRTQYHSIRSSTAAAQRGKGAVRSGAAAHHLWCFLDEDVAAGCWLELVVNGLLEVWNGLLDTDLLLLDVWK